MAGPYKHGFFRRAGITKNQADVSSAGTTDEIRRKSQSRRSRHFSTNLKDDVCFFHNRYANQQLLALIVLSDTNKLLQTSISKMKRKCREMFVFSDITAPSGLCACTMMRSCRMRSHRLQHERFYTADMILLKVKARSTWGRPLLKCLLR